MKSTMFKAVLLAGCATVGFASVAMAAPGDTKISGRIYADASYISQKTDGVKTDKSGTGLDVKRFYVGVDHEFDDMFSVNVTTDFNYVSNDSETQVYIKKAFLQAKVSDALTVRVGSADLPWVPFVEGVYGYRYVENVLADRQHYGTSADYGVHFLGKFADGMISYQGSVINGAGYKKLTRSKSVDFEGRISAEPIPGLIMGVGAYSGKLGKDLETAPAMHTATRLDALVAYKTKQFTIGGEYLHVKNWNQVTSVAEDKSEGYSIFGSFNFDPKAAVFARYDYTKPSKTLDNTKKDNYFNVGVSYDPVKGVSLALVYKYDKLKNSVTETKTDEFGLWVKGRF